MTTSTDKVLEHILEDLIQMDVVPGIERAKFRDIDDPCVSGHLLELLRQTTAHYKEYREREQEDSVCTSDEYAELEQYVALLEKREVANAEESERKIKNLEDTLASIRQTIENQRTNPDQ